MRMSVTDLAGAALLTAVVACSTGETPPNDVRSPAPGVPSGDSATDPVGTPGAPGTADRPDTTRNAPSPRPGTIADTLEVEGMREVRRATLVRPRQGLDLPFSTYLPEGMNAEYPPQPDGAAVRFVAGFAGVVRPEAYMHVHVHAPGATVDQARAVVSRFLAGKTVRPVDVPAWAEEAHGFDYDVGGERYTGRVILARHDARVFHIIHHYPPEYGDGLGPRFHSIMKHWRWEDSGELLIGSSEARR